MSDMAIDNTSGEERRVVTLDQLLLNVREKIGELKDSVLLSIENKVESGTPVLIDKDNILVKDHLPFDYVTDTEQYIYRILVDAQRDPLIVHHENEKVRKQAVSQIQEVARDACMLPLGMTLRELVVLSNKARQLYRDLLPIVEESRLIDHKTGLRISDYLMDYSFEQFKDYFAHPDQHLSIAYLDMNNFKRYNDICGWQQADVAIQQTATLLKRLPEGVVVTRKNDKRGDEFMLFMNTDAEGAQRLMQRLFVQPFEEQITDLVKAGMKQYSGYNSDFDEMGSKLSFAVGISSTRLPTEIPLFERARKRRAVTNDSISRDLEYFTSRPDSEWHDAYVNLNPELRKRVIINLRETLMAEAEDAAHLAKNLSKDQNDKENYGKSLVRVYDPSLPKEKYIYVSSR